MRALRPAPLFLILATTLAVLAAGPAAAQYSFDWDITWQGAVKDLLILEDFTTHVTNTAAVPDSFKVTLVKDMSPSWQATICEGPVCYPPFVTVHTFNLGPGESTNLDFAITAAVEEGRGSSVVTVESLSDPAVTELNTFTIITSGLDVLTVDAADNPEYVTYYTEALNSTGRTHATWSHAVMGTLTGTDLANFDAVVWFVGTNAAGLNEADRNGLLDYVGGGGNLFLTGQNLARDFCSPASPHYTPASRAWFGQLLGIDFLADDAGTPLVNGVSGDPISDGMILAINGGDGANNNVSPDAVTTLSNGVAAMTYYTGQDAAVRGAYLEGRTFFAGFGFEGISLAATRNDVMTSVLDWIISRFSAVGDGLPAVLVSRPYVTPNPFNPQTSLKFEVGGDRAVDSEVVIYDLRGRAVRSLFRGILEPGPRSMVWNGRDDSGRSLSSGVYLARVKVAGDIQTVKMTLAR